MTDLNSSEPAELTMPQLLELVEMLTLLIGEENAQLRLGAPTALAATMALKVKLAAELERRMRGYRAVGTHNAGVDAAKLAERSAALRLAMQENSVNLRRAMTSTRRRVDAIMHALREQDSKPGRYDNSGRRTLAYQPAPRAGRSV